MRPLLPVQPPYPCNVQDTRQAVPAFITILVMPLTYSIAYGLVAGIMTCTILWFLDTLWETVAVLSGYYKGTKTMRHVWLDAFSNWYCAFNREDVSGSRGSGWWGGRWDASPTGDGGRCIAPQGTAWFHSLAHPACTLHSEAPAHPLVSLLLRQALLRNLHWLWCTTPPIGDAVIR